MTNLARKGLSFRARKSLCCAAGLAILVQCAVLGCEKKEEIAPPPAPKRVERPTSPSVSELPVGKGVEFVQSRVPVDAALATSIAQLASAFAAGDADVLQPLLDTSGQAVLQALLDSGQWASQTGCLESVRVCAVRHDGETASVELGLQESADTGDGRAYMLAWTAAKQGDAWQFTGVPSDRTAARATAFDSPSGG